jgi:L-ascorbate metabolism protein UlaG (beta-lactamase superfamily)
MKFLIAIAILLAVPVALGFYFSAPAYDGPASKHFDGEKFLNANRDNKTFRDFIKWIFSRKKGSWPETKTNGNFPPPQEFVAGANLRVTFVNHSTFLIQVDGVNILTDPIWSERCSPVSFLGPKRLRPPGVAFHQLPRIDVVLVSHNHYDHMDVPTLKALSDRDSPRVFAGLGNARFLAQNGVTNAMDIDWWQSLEVKPGLRIWGVPAQHFSGRGLMDRNKTLWMGFVIQSQNRLIYFAGDTGFGPHFQEIYDKFGAIDLALLPIGAFLPKWFMQHVHVSPQEAVDAARILRAKTSIGMHFGTFQLADDSELEPVEGLREALKASAVPLDFRTLDFGEGYHLDFGAKREAFLQSTEAVGS